MHFEPLDRPLLWEFSDWAPTLRRWYAEGLPWVTGFPDNLDDSADIPGEYQGIDWRVSYHDEDVHRALGLDVICSIALSPCECKSGRIHVKSE